MKFDPASLPPASQWTLPGLAILLLHSTDDPSLAVAGLRAAHASTAGTINSARPRRRPILVLDAEGVRIAAIGVLGALSTGGRPNLGALVTDFQAKEGIVLVVEAAWRDRGFQDDALIPGAMLVPADQLSGIAAANYSLCSY